MIVTRSLQTSAAGYSGRINACDIKKLCVYTFIRNGVYINRQCPGRAYTDLHACIGVVDQDIQTAILFVLDLLKQLFDVIFFGGITDHRQAVAPPLLYLKEDGPRQNYQ